MYTYLVCLLMGFSLGDLKSSLFTNRRLGSHVFFFDGATFFFSARLPFFFPAGLPFSFVMILY